jgi:t-SNARE complex subunit (syntaxin)
LQPVGKITVGKKKEFKEPDKVKDVEVKVEREKQYLSEKLSELEVKEAEVRAIRKSIDVSLERTQEAEAKAAAELKAKQEAAAKLAATKKATITCVKGKLTKKVTAMKPACPAGYKKK